MKFFKDIPRNVLALGFVSMITDISGEMVFSVLPIYMSAVLGIDKALIGVIEGLANAGANISKLFSGYLSDRFGKRKPLVLAGYALSAIMRPFFAFAVFWNEMLFVRVVERLGKGLREAPRDAIIASSTAGKSRGKNFGVHRAMDSMGAIIGPALAFAILAATADDFKLLFWVSLVPGAIALIILYLFVKEKAPRKRIEQGKKEEITAAFVWKRFSPEYKRFLLTVAVFYVGNFSIAFFLLKANDLGLAAAMIPLAYLTYNLFYTLAAVPFGSLSDKIGRKGVLGIGYAAFGLSCIGFVFMSELWMVWALFALYGCFKAAVETVQRAYASELVEEKVRATALGAYNAIVGLALLPASVIAGVLWTAFGSTATFAFGAVMSFAAVAMMIVSRSR
ncbi:MAG: MFS transporter [Candidatus Micrarchaeota archaeon]